MDQKDMSDDFIQGLIKHATLPRQRKILDNKVIIKETSVSEEIIKEEVIDLPTERNQHINVLLNKLLKITR